MGLVGVNMLGQNVDVEHPSLASGYYLYTDESAQVLADRNQLNCPFDPDTGEGMRPGMMNIKGAGKIPTCGGRVMQEDLPDIHVVDWRFRVYVQLALAAMVFVLVVKLGYTIYRK